MKVFAMVYPGMTLLDLVGPLQAWSFLPGYEVQYVWRRSGAAYAVLRNDASSPCVAFVPG